MHADPVLQELNRRTVAQRGMPAPPVVENFDVLKEIGLRMGPRRVDRTVHPLVLEAVEEALGGCVVPAVAFAAHAGDEAVRLEYALIARGGILTAAVRVVHKPRRTRPIS